MKTKGQIEEEIKRIVLRETMRKATKGPLEDIIRNVTIGELEKLRWMLEE